VAGLAGYALAATFTVSLTSGGPQPGLFTASLGDTVTFVNHDSATHTVVDKSIGLQSPALGPGQAWTYVLTTSGRHTYSQGKPGGSGQIDVKRTGTVTLTTKKRAVPYGSGTVLSGTTSLPGFPVTIEEKGKAGGERWDELDTVTPDADGSFTLPIQPDVSAQYRATVFGGELLSSFINVDVRPLLKLATSRRVAAAGSLVTFVAHVVPVGAADALELMRFDPKRLHWRRVARANVSSSGKVIFRWRADYGTILLRAAAVQHDLVRGYAAAASRAVSVKGTGTPPSRHGGKKH